MIGSLNNTLAAALAAILVSTAGTAKADIILEQYEFAGQPGTETTLAPSFVAPNLTGTSFGERAVTPAPGANAIAASGWTDPAAAFTFGIAVDAGYAVTVDRLVLTSRSSSTGPGLLNVLAAADGGAYAVVATITQTGSTYNDESLGITPVTATSTLSFQIVAANQTSASGGTIAAAGTFRVGDENPAGAAAPTPFSLLGTVTALPPAAVPEPATLLLLAGALATLSRARPKRDA